MSDTLPAIITAVATIILAGVALYGNEFRRLVRRPRLLLKIDNPVGNGTFFTTPSGARDRGCRWFHLNVSNSIRDFPFHNVSVHLLEFKERAQSGAFQTVWKGSVPLQWRHEPLFQVVGDVIIPRRFEPKTVGPLAQADLFHIDENGALGLSPITMPNDLNAKLKHIAFPAQPISFALILQAASDEADSQTYQIDVHWSGKWAEADSDFQRFVQIEEHRVTAKV